MMEERHFDIVCFDCDSTLSRIEGIDALGKRAGVEELVAPLTAAAMAGELQLDEVYGKRLDFVRPDQAAIEWLAALYIDEMVAGAQETVARLQAAGKDVRILSGGLRQSILPLGQALGIAPSSIHAVDLILAADGAYGGFDQTSPLVRPGGKAEVCQTLGVDGRRVALVGDGATDLEAREGGAFIIGFGGVARREAVVAGADIFVEGPSLTAVLAPLSI